MATIIIQLLCGFLAIIILVHCFKFVKGWFLGRKRLTKKDLVSYDSIDLIIPDPFRQTEAVVRFTKGNKIAYLKHGGQSGIPLITTQDIEDANTFVIAGESATDFLDDIAEYLNKSALIAFGTIKSIRREETKALKEPSKFTQELLDDLKKAGDNRDWTEVERINSTLQSNLA